MLLFQLEASMKSKLFPGTGTCDVMLAALLLFSSCLVAQGLVSENRHRAVPLRYKLLDLGTFGGPISYGSINGNGSRLLNEAGTVASYADLATGDPLAPDLCAVPDCLLAHAGLWRHGKPFDLGALNGRYFSAAGSINDRGWSVGQSQTGAIVPVPIFPNGFPVFHAALWKGRSVTDLNSLPGGTFSIALSINNRGQVAGFSDNGIPDPYAMFPTGTQTRAVLWEHGRMKDIGTLGGPDAAPGNGCDNQRPGVVVGASYVDFTPNASSGIPTQNPFLWDNGTMTNLGNLGGTLSFALCTNDHEEVIGNSNLPGDQTFHGFVWRNGEMKDLGTLGGPDSEAVWINQAGEIAGSADLPAPNIHDAVVWRNGYIHDLGTIAGDACSRGRAINSWGQVVGGSSDCRNFLHAFVWEEGGPMRDLNALIRPGSGLQLTNAFNINDRGEILAKSFPIGSTPNDDADLGHLVLLIPCDTDDPDGECGDWIPSPGAASLTSQVAATHRPASATQSPHSLTAEDGARDRRTSLTRRLASGAFPH
jgi:probable HAF family extracellular repeat protein